MATTLPAASAVVSEKEVSTSPPAAETPSLPAALPRPISDSEPTLILRRACVDDYAKGHCDLLAQLTQIGSLTSESYARRMKQILGAGDTYHLLVIEDTRIGTIVASATLIVEWKFVHGCGAAGHIEDVVVQSGYRGRRLGESLLAALHDIAREQGCYKVMLDCSEANMTYYQRAGYRQAERHMRLDL